MNLLWPPPLPHETYSSSSQSDVSHLETQEEHHAQAQSAVDGTILALGIKALALLHDAGGLLLMAFLFVRRLIVLRVDSLELGRQFYRFCFGSIPITFGGSCIVGGVVAMQGLSYLSKYNATEVFGWAAGLSAYREVGPLLLGLTIAARLGAKNTAELMTMRSRNRLESLTALGIDVTSVVLLPRFLAIAFSTVILFPICGITILATAFFLAEQIGGQNVFISWHSFTTYVYAYQILQGFLRMTLFGLWVGLCSCYFACHRDERDARAIGRAVFSSSVASMCGVVMINLYLSFIVGAG